MIKYKNCTEVELEKVYNAFTIGFSDYMIKFEMSKEVFINHFLGPEGNKLEYSFIALDEERPVGLILSGIKDYEGIKTMRCGTLCIDPEYRGKGISQKLFELHKETAIYNKCKQMFLEVIVGNDRAIKFYENCGYHKVYDLKYYYKEDTKNIIKSIKNSMDIMKISFEEIAKLSYITNNIHINWQCDFDYMKALGNIIHYGVYENSELVAAMSISPGGKIYFIWTKLEYRNKGIAQNLINKAVNDINPEKLYISFANNANVEGFLNKINFEKDRISQYEMYLTL